MKVIYADGSSEEYQDARLGSGTQGDVYLSRDGHSVVKMYNNYLADDNRHIMRIETLISRHNPIKADPYWGQFLAWPEKLVVSPRTGYRMRYARMKSIAHYLFKKSYKRLPPEEKGWFIGRVASAMHLVSVASLFARMGLCYPDFSDHNVLVDPYAGLMVLIDCDSLMHKDRPDILSATVQGTSSFRAPELVAGITRYPTVITDRHALAVILYRWLLMGKHPLIGDRVCSDDSDLDDQNRFSKPVYWAGS